MAPSRKKKDHPLVWLAEPLMEERGYMERPMFGCLAVYLHGRLMLVLASGEDPWDGVLIPTGHESHASVMGEYPGVVQHSVLKKWLYLPLAYEDFEAAASEVVEAVRRGDPRFGVEPKGRKAGKRKGRAARRGRPGH